MGALYGWRRSGLDNSSFLGVHNWQVTISPAHGIKLDPPTGILDLHTRLLSAVAGKSPNTDRQRWRCKLQRRKFSLNYKSNRLLNARSILPTPSRTSSLPNFSRKTGTICCELQHASSVLRILNIHPASQPPIVFNSWQHAELLQRPTPRVGSEFRSQLMGPSNISSTLCPSHMAPCGRF